MSFSFNAVGTREEVLAQLEARDKRYGGAVADRAADLVTTTIEGETHRPDGKTHGYELRYVIDASGHTGDGSSASSLTISISSRYITIAREAEPGNDVAPA